MSDRETRLGVASDATLPAGESDIASRDAKAASDYPAMVTVDPGHYVVADEIARGGMGRIRVAHDRRLGRRIALKEMLSRRGELAARFEREAKITARLEHPAIVSVHEAGSWPTGEPFMAMRLVNGRSLDDEVAQAQSFEARLALLPNVLAIADAMAYAHEQGVIHRDLKPRNVLIGKFGETVVIDWGLAKDQRATEESFANLAVAAPEDPPPSGTDDTMSSTQAGFAPAPSGESSRGTLTVAGSVMGTPAYMPPEQARGEVVDARADVYAIGAILYHVLAGRAPIQARSADEALASAVAYLITPLATLVPDVPIDLLAIVGKAMARDPLQRYPSARELADDLRRFQTGQLVGAHRYSLRQLLGKWLRRHRAMVAVISIALLAVATLSVIGVRKIIAERAEAERQRTIADASRADGDQLVAYMLDDMRQQLEQLGRLDLLDAVTSRAIEHYRRGTPIEIDKLATAYQARGAVVEAMGRLDQAISLTQQAVVLRTAVMTGDPSANEPMRLLAASERRLGDLLISKRDLARAQLAAERALTYARVLTDRDPRRELRLDLASAQKKVGDVMRARGDIEHALIQFRESLAIREQLARETPGDLELQRGVAIAHERLGQLLQQQGKPEAALAEYRAAVEVARAMVARDPTNNRTRRRDLTVLQFRIGDLLAATGDHAAAIASYRSAQTNTQTLANENPNEVTYLRDLSISHSLIGRALLTAGDHEGALTEARADLAIALKLTARDPSNAEWQRDLSVSHETLADALLAAGDRAGALREVQASLAIALKLVERDRSDPRRRDDLAGTYDKLAAVFTALGDTARAADARRSAEQARRM